MRHMTKSPSNENKVEFDATLCAMAQKWKYLEWTFIYSSVSLKHPYSKRPLEYIVSVG